MSINNLGDTKIVTAALKSLRQDTVSHIENCPQCCSWISIRRGLTCSGIGRSDEYLQHLPLVLYSMYANENVEKLTLQGIDFISLKPAALRHWPRC